MWGTVPLAVAVRIRPLRVLRSLILHLAGAVSEALRLSHVDNAFNGMRFQPWHECFASMRGARCHPCVVPDAIMWCTTWHYDLPI